MWFRRDVPPSRIRPGDRFSAEQVRKFVDYRHRELVEAAAGEGFIRHSFIARSPSRSKHQWAYPWEEFHVVIGNEEIGLFDTTRFDKPITEAGSGRYFTPMREVRSFRLVEEPEEVKRLVGLSADDMNAEMLVHELEVPTLLLIESEGAMVMRPEDEQSGPICHQVLLAPRSNDGGDEALRKAVDTLRGLTDLP